MVFEKIFLKTHLRVKFKWAIQFFFYYFHSRGNKIGISWVHFRNIIQISFSVITSSSHNISQKRFRKIYNTFRKLSGKFIRLHAYLFLLLIVHIHVLCLFMVFAASVTYLILMHPLSLRVVRSYNRFKNTLYVLWIFFPERLRITESKISYSLHKFHCFEVNQIYLMIKIYLKIKFYSVTNA